MALPVTGPVLVLRQLSVNSTQSYYIKQSKYRQRRPIDRPLPYEMTRVKVLSAAVFGTHVQSTEANATISSGGNKMLLEIDSKDQYQLERNIAISACSSKIRKRYLAANVEIGITIAERQRTIDMITKRGRQLLVFLLHLKNGRLRAARNAATQFGWRKPGPRKRPPRAKRPPTAEERNKQAADLLLEVQFGWKPLAETLYNGMKVLSDPMPSVNYRVGSHPVPVDSEYKVGGIVMHTASNVSYSHTVGKIGCAARGTIYISDVNQYLLNRMGIINPFSVAWDAIPFSFVVDWFINVKSFLDSFTDYLGTETRNSSWSEYVNLNRTADYRYQSWRNDLSGYTVVRTYIYSNRGLGLPPTKLVIKHFQFDMFHARTVWALVVQNLYNRR